MTPEEQQLRACRQLRVIRRYAKSLKVSVEIACYRWVDVGNAKRWAKGEDMSTKSEIEDVKSELSTINQQCIDKPGNSELKRMRQQLREELIKLTAKLIQEEKE